MNILQVLVQRNVCLLRCKHCSVRAGATANARLVPLEIAKDIFARVADLREASQVSIEHLFLQWGDEELCGDDDVTLHEYVASLPTTHIPVFSTNGLWLGNLGDDEARQTLERLKRAGKTQLQASFHGLESTHDAFVGRREAFRTLVRAVSYALSAKLTVRCQVFVNRRNAREVRDLCDMLKNECGIADSNMSFPVTNLIGRALQHEKLRLDAPTLALLPQRVQANLSSLLPETRLREQVAANTDALSDHLSDVLNPQDRLLIKITECEDVLFSTAWAASTGHAVCLGNLASCSLVDMFDQVQELRAEENRSLPDLRQLAEFADDKNQRIYTARDGYLLWMFRMRKSNNTSEGICR